MNWSNLIEKAISVRKELHAIPELSWQEEKTCHYMRTLLDKEVISYRKCAQNGLVATIGQDKKGQHLAFRADMDGLPLTEKTTVSYQSQHVGCMHGCGHDGHMATLWATAVWLKYHESELPGPVSFIFQPAEEGGYGAKKMIEGGALEGIDMIFGWHNWPTIDFGQVVCTPGPIMAANASLDIVVNGRGGHGSQPEQCKDPILAASAIILGLQQIVSRRWAPQKPLVISVTTVEAFGGETTIPDNARIRGTVRFECEDEINTLNTLITSAAEDIAKGYNVQADVTLTSRYPAVINDLISAKWAGEKFNEVFGANWQSETSLVPIMASEDYSYYLREIPGAFALVGAGEHGFESIPCHNSSYDFNDELIAPMVRVMSKLAGID